MRSKSDAVAADPLTDGSLQTANRCLVDVWCLRACPLMPEFLGSGMAAQIAFISTIALLGWAAWALITFEIGVRLMPQ